MHKFLYKLSPIIGRIVINTLIFGLIVSITSWYITDQIMQKRTKEINDIRTISSGIWQFGISNKIDTDQQTNTWIFETGSLSTDNNLNLSGKIVLNSELQIDKSTTSNLIITELQGSIINNNIILSGYNSEHNLVFINAQIDPNSLTIKGIYFENIADNYGLICGRKILYPNKIINIYNSKINKTIKLHKIDSGDQKKQIIKDCTTNLND